MAYPLREDFYYLPTEINWKWKEKGRVNRFRWNAAASNAVMTCLLKDYVAWCACALMLVWFNLIICQQNSNSTHATQ